MSLRWKLQRSANLKKDYFVFFFDIIPRSAKILTFFLSKLPLARAFLTCKGPSCIPLPLCRHRDAPRIQFNRHCFIAALIDWLTRHYLDQNYKQYVWRGRKNYVENHLGESNFVIFTIYHNKVVHRPWKSQYWEGRKLRWLFCNSLLLCLMSIGKK